MEHVGASVIARYFARLDEGDAVGASALFAPNAIYIRPAVDEAGRPASGLEELEGREAIRRFFVDRGKRPYRHTIRHVARQGDVEFVEGFVDGGTTLPCTAFLATATLDSESLIVRYLASAATVSSGDLSVLGRVPAST